MKLLGDLVRWLAGGPDGYMTLVHCMNNDTFWIGLTVILDLAVALGYALIAHHWWQNEKSLPKCHAKTALGQMKRIFLFCGMCGYLFIPIKMIWPAWRLYDFVMIALVFFTWRYALNARQLRVVYHELGRSKQLAYELEESRAESKRKSFFLNAVSHDLRTPLNGLMLQAELAEMSVDGNDVESLRDSLREIKACARTTADLLGSFLELARLDWSDDSTRETRFPLAELIAQVTNAARPQAESKGVEIRAESPAGLFLVTDRVKLERILQNLLGNGVKFTDRGRVEVTVTTSGRDVSIVVADTGVGIPAAQLESIFDEFYQVDNSERDRGKGFGLGLSIARRLARQLRGDLTVESEVGRGSRFSVTLTGAIDGGAAGHSFAKPDSPSRGKSKTAARG
jgi:signal transduction histidine kinase